MKLKTSKQAVKAGFLILALLFWCASLWGQRFSEIIVFGDSLSDTGNTHIASGGFHYQPPYFEGRATNGETWVEYLARDLGLDVAAVGPYTLGGLNFAHGYAETGPGYRKLRDRGGVEVPVGPIPNVGEQIEIFISTGHSIAPDGLVVIWAGANDLIFNLLEGADPNVLISTVLTNLNGHISELIALGARNFLVLGQPDYGLTPLGLVADPAGLSFVAAVYNSNLEGMLNAIGTAAPHLTLYYSDTASIIQELVADPAAYGLVDVMNPTLDPNGADFFFAGYTGIDPETSLFWDLVHPTTLGHQLLADSIEFPPGRSVL
jgi:phospholipase/lecithinase/hemolysin